MHTKEIRNAYEADQVLPKPHAGEVWSYARKSNRERHRHGFDGTTKSIVDQNKVNRRTAERYDLPLIDSCVLSERPGLGGDIWWDGVTLGTETGGKREVRPEFSRLRNKILEGECKVVIAFAQCRLFRDVGIANAFMDLCVAHGVRVYDANGLLDIWSSDGRAHIRYLANDNQRQREKTGGECQRGIEECWAKNELCIPAGRLGFRSLGYRSKQVRAIPEELEWVRWIFRAWVYGIDHRGPLSLNSITQILTADTSFVWTPDLVELRGSRLECNRGTVYIDQLRRLLRDETYIGKQRRGGRVTDCPSFLVDGQTVVDVELFNLAQRKLNAHRGKKPGQGRTVHVFSGLVRCGQCGQRMKVGRTSRAGIRTKAWTRYCISAESTCNHYLPAVCYDTLVSYFVEFLAPLMRVELETRESAVTLAAALHKRDLLSRELSEHETWIRDELPRYALAVSPELASAMEQLKSERLSEIRVELRRIDEETRSEAWVIDRLRDVDALPESLLIDVVDQTIQWVAMMPITGRPKDNGRVGAREAPWASKIIFCTSFGTYHTAELERKSTSGGREAVECRFWVEHRPRPADESEILGSANDLPMPAAFASELIRSAAIAKVEFRPDLQLPGIHSEHLAEGHEIASKMRPVHSSAKDLGSEELWETNQLDNI